MPACIRSARLATNSEWDEAARTCSHATFFHTRAWADLWASVSGLEPGALCCDFTDGQRLIVPFSLKKGRRGFVRERLLSAAGTYGGALYGAGVTLEHLLAAIRCLARGHSISWRLSPYEPYAGEIAVVLSTRSTNFPHSWKRHENSSETLALDDLRRNGGLLKHVHYNCRKQILKGQRAGISVRLAVAADEWQDFMGLYRDAVARWGEKATMSYPDKLFQALQILDPEACRLWLAYHEGRLVGGSVNFYHNRHAVEWLAAYDPGSFPLGVRNRLTWHMIEHAMAINGSIYDFNPSGTLEGTRRFKQTFNTCQRQTPLLVRRTMLRCALEWIGR
ncbi:MAG: GNAT family N-acetyltransferase [Candidatus Aminicenantes bacterium]|nr:GNAT family N-acetyltransferase [Candidatus Aminicenantes bacterium]